MHEIEMLKKVLLMLNMLGEIFSRRHGNIFLIFPEKDFDISSLGDNLHEMSNTDFWGKSEKYDPYLVC